MTHLLPNRTDGVSANGWVRCHQCQTVFDGLADEQAVKGILMQQRQSLNMGHVSHGYPENLKFQRLGLSLQKFKDSLAAGVDCDLAMFDQQLPHRYGAQ